MVSKHEAVVVRFIVGHWGAQTREFQPETIPRAIVQLDGSLEERTRCSVASPLKEHTSRIGVGVPGVA